MGVGLAVRLKILCTSLNETDLSYPASMKFFFKITVKTSLLSL